MGHGWVIVTGSPRLPILPPRSCSRVSIESCWKVENAKQVGRNCFTLIFSLDRIIHSQGSLLILLCPCSFASRFFVFCFFFSMCVMESRQLSHLDEERREFSGLRANVFCILFYDFFFFRMHDDDDQGGDDLVFSLWRGCMETVELHNRYWYDTL